MDDELNYLLENEEDDNNFQDNTMLNIGLDTEYDNGVYNTQIQSQEDTETLLEIPRHTTYPALTKQQDIYANIDETALNAVNRLSYPVFGSKRKVANIPPDMASEILGIYSNLVDEYKSKVSPDNTYTIQLLDAIKKYADAKRIQFEQSYIRDISDETSEQFDTANKYTDIYYSLRSGYTDLIKKQYPDITPDLAGQYSTAVMDLLLSENPDKTKQIWDRYGVPIDQLMTLSNSLPAPNLDNDTINELKKVHSSHSLAQAVDPDRNLISIDAFANVINNVNSFVFDKLGKGGLPFAVAEYMFMDTVGLLSSFIAGAFNALYNLDLSEIPETMYEVQAVVRKNIGDLIKQNYGDNTYSYIINDVANAVGQIGGGIIPRLYYLKTLVTPALLSAPATGGQSVTGAIVASLLYFGYLGLKGLESYGASYIDTLMKGGTNSTAMMRGTFSGLATVAVESLPFEKILNIPGEKDIIDAFVRGSVKSTNLLATSVSRHVLNNIVKGGGVEGFEGFLEKVFNLSYDYVADQFELTEAPLSPDGFWGYVKEIGYDTAMEFIGGASGSALFNVGGGIRYLMNRDSIKQLNEHFRNYEKLVYTATTKLTDRGTVLNGNVFGTDVNIELGVFAEDEARELLGFLEQVSSEMQLPAELSGVKTLANNYISLLERARMMGNEFSPEVEEARSALANAVYNKNNYRQLYKLGFELMHAKVAPVYNEDGTVSYNIKVYSDLFNSGLLQDISDNKMSSEQILEDRLAHEIGHVILRQMPYEQFTKLLQNIDVNEVRKYANKYGVATDTVIFAMSNPQILMANDEMLESIGYKDTADNIRLVRSALEDTIIEQKLLPFIKHGRNVMKLASFYGAKDVLDFYKLLNNGLIPSKPKYEVINPDKIYGISNSMEFSDAVNILNSDNVFDTYSYEYVLGATLRVLNDENLYEHISNSMDDTNKAISRAIYVSESVLNKLKAKPNTQDTKTVELFNDTLVKAKSTIVENAVNSIDSIFDNYDISNATDLLNMVNRLGSALVEIFDVWQDVPDVIKRVSNTVKTRFGTVVRRTLTTLDKSIGHIEKNININTDDVTTVSEGEEIFGIKLAEANKPVLSVLRGSLLSIRAHIVTLMQALGNVNSNEKLSNEDSQFVSMLKNNAQEKVSPTLDNLNKALITIDKAIEKVENKLADYNSEEQLLTGSAKYRARVEAIKKSKTIDNIVGKFPVLDKYAGRLRNLSLQQLDEIDDALDKMDDPDEIDKYVGKYIHKNDLEDVKIDIVSELPVYEKLLQYIVDNEIVSKKEFSQVYTKVSKFVDKLVFPKYLSNKLVNKVKSILTDILVISEFMKNRRYIDNLLHNIVMDESSDYFNIFINNLSQMYSVASHILSMCRQDIDSIIKRLDGLIKVKNIAKNISRLPYNKLREVVSDDSNAKMVRALFNGDLDVDKFYREFIKSKSGKKPKRDIDNVSIDTISDEQELNEIILEELETLLDNDVEPEIPIGFNTSIKKPLSEKVDKVLPTEKPIVKKRGKRKKSVETAPEVKETELKDDMSPKRRIRKTIVNNVREELTESQKNIIDVVSNSTTEVKKVSDNSVQVKDIAETSGKKSGSTVYPISDALNLAFGRDYKREVSKGHKLAYYFLLTRIRYIDENALSKLSGNIKSLYDGSVLAFNNFKEYIVKKYGDRKANSMFYNYSTSNWYNEIDEWVNAGGKSVSTYLDLAKKVDDADVDTFITGKRIRRGTDYSASFVDIDERILDVVTSSVYNGDNVDMFSLDRRVVTPHKVVVRSKDDISKSGIVYVLNDSFEPITHWLWSVSGRKKVVKDTPDLYVQLYEEYRQMYGMNAVGAMYYELLSRLMFSDEGVEQLAEFKRTGVISDLIRDLNSFNNILSSDSFYNVLNSSAIDTLNNVASARGKLTLNRVKNTFLNIFNERIRNTFGESIVDVFNISEEQSSDNKVAPNVYVLKTLPSQERFIKEVLCFLHNVSLSDEFSGNYDFIYPELVRLLNNHIKFVLYKLSLANVGDGSLVIYDAGRISKSTVNSMAVYKNTPFIVYLFILNDLLVSKKLKNNALLLSFNDLNMSGLIDTFVSGVYKKVNDSVRNPSDLQYVDKFGYVRDLDYLLSVGSNELLSRSLEDTIRIWSDASDILREFYFDLVNKHPHLKEIITNIIVSGSLLNKVSVSGDFIIDKNAVIDELLRIQPLSIEVIDRINHWLSPESLQRLGRFVFDVTASSPLLEDMLFKRLSELMQIEDVDKRFETALLRWNELYTLMSELVKLDGEWTKEISIQLRSILETKGVSNDLLDAVWIDLSKIHYKKRANVLNSIISRIAYTQEVLLGSVIIPHVFESGYVPSRLGSGVTFVDILMNDLSRLISSARQLVTMYEVEVGKSDKTGEDIVIPYDGVIIADSLWSLYGTKRETSFIDTKTEPHEVIPISRDTISSIGIKYHPKYISLPSIATAIQMFLSRDDMALFTSSDLDTIRSYYSEILEKKYRESIDYILGTPINETPEQVIEILNSIDSIDDIEKLKDTHPSLYRVLDTIRLSIVSMSVKPFSYSMKGVEGNISIPVREENYYSFLGGLGVIRVYLDRLFGSIAPSELRKRIYTSMILPFMNISIMHSVHRGAFNKNVIYRAGLLSGLYEEGVIDDIVSDAYIIVRDVVSSKLKGINDTLLHAYTGKLADWLSMYRAWLTSNYKAFPVETKQFLYPPIDALTNVEKVLYNVLLSDKGIGLKYSSDTKSGISSNVHRAIVDLFLTTSYILQNIEGYGSYDLSDVDVVSDLEYYRFNLNKVSELIERIEKEPKRFRNKTLLLLSNIRSDLNRLSGYYNKTVKEAMDVMEFPVAKSGVVRYSGLSNLYGNKDVIDILRKMYGDHTNDVINAEKFIMDLLYNYINRSDIKPIHNVLFGDIAKYVGIMGSNSYNDLIRAVGIHDVERANKLANMVIKHLSPASNSIFDAISEVTELKSKFNLLKHTRNQREALLRSFVTSKVSASFVIPSEEFERMYVAPKKKTSRVYSVFSDISDKLRAHGTTGLTKELDELVKDSKKFPVLAVSLQNTAVKVSYDLPILFKQLETMFNSYDVSKSELLELMDNIRNGMKVLWARKELASNIGATLKSFDSGEFNQEDVEKVLNALDIKRGKLRDSLTRIINKRLGSKRTPKGDACSFLFDMFDLSSKESEELRGELLDLGDLDVVITALNVAIDELSKVNIERIDPTYFKLALFGDTRVRGAIDTILGNTEKMTRIVSALLDAGIATNVDELIDRLQVNDFTYEELAFMARVIGGELHKSSSLSSKIYSFRVNSLLSGVITLGKNLSEFVYGLYRLALVDHTEALLSFMIGDTSKVKAVFVRDRLLVSTLWNKMLSLLWSNLKITFENKMSGMKLRMLSFGSAIHTDKLPPVPLPTTKYGKAFWKTVTATTSILFTVDETAKTLFGFWNAVKHSAEKAINNGLEGIEDIRNFIMDDLFVEDDSGFIINRVSESWHKAEKEMDAVTFTEMFENKTLQRVHDTLKYELGLKWLTPFTTVIANMTKVAFRNSVLGFPLELSKFGWMFLSGIMGGNIRDFKGIPAYVKTHYIGDSEDKLRKIAEMLSGLVFIFILPQLFFKFYDDFTFIPQRKRGYLRMDIPDGSVITPSGNVYILRFFEPLYQTLSLNKRVYDAFNLLAERYSNNTLTKSDAVDILKNASSGIMDELVDYGALRTLHDIDIVLQQPANISRLLVNWFGGFVPNAIKYVSNRILADELYFGRVMSPFNMGDYITAITQIPLDVRHLQISMFGHPVSNPLGKNVVQRMMNSLTAGLKPMYFDMPISEYERELYKMIQLATIKTGKTGLYMPPSPVLEYTNSYTGGLGNINVIINPLHLKEMESVIGQLFRDVLLSNYGYLSELYRINPDGFMDTLDNIHRRITTDVRTVVKNQYSAYAFNKLLRYRNMGYTGDITVEAVANNSVPLGLEFYYQVEPNVYKKYRETLYK